MTLTTCKVYTCEVEVKLPFRVPFAITSGRLDARPGLGATLKALRRAILEGGKDPGKKHTD